ncbi:hypothetical protein SUGI_0259060 [Cryptomeria japonica]|nr:hypothetical protein SUGI_0259060 [Cryptomeria japonica]
MRSLGFILYVINSLLRPEAYEIRRYLLVERLLGCMDIGVDENGEEEDENYWGTGTRELCIPDDGRDVEVIVVGESYSRCGPDYPVIAKAFSTRRMGARVGSSSEYA